MQKGWLGEGIFQVKIAIHWDLSHPKKKVMVSLERMLNLSWSLVDLTYKLGYIGDMETWSAIKGAKKGHRQTNTKFQWQQFVLIIV